MTRTTQLALLVLCFAALALAKKHSLVEKAGSSKHIKEWQPLPTKPHHDEAITLGFALKQKNLDQLEETFNRVSDPAHADFGKHLTTQQLADMVGASDDTIDDVKKWLHKHDAKSIKVSNTRDYIWATLTARDIEKLLNIEMNVYLHQSTKLSKNAYISRSVDSPYVPSEFADQIDFVSGVWHFPSTKSLFKNVKDNLVEKAMSNRAAAEEFDSVVVIPSILQSAGAPEGISIYFEPVCSTGNTSESLQPCTDFNNPIVTYNVTTWQLDYTNKLVVKSQILTSSAVNCTIEESLFGDLLYCIATAGNLLDDSYVNATFSYCFQDKTCTETGTAAGFGVGLPIVPSALHTPTDVRSHYGVPASLVGGNAKNSQAVAAFIYQFFSPADLALFFKEVGLPQYTVQKVIGPNNPPFPGVEASLDIQYIMGVAQGVNTWFWSMGGSSWIAEWGQAVLNTPNAPWVHSISYGEGESYVTASYIARSEAELQKLGAAGHSVMVASGDDGSGDDCDVYAPDWPTSSPSVTSVGATRITRGATPACQANPAGSGCSTVGDVSAAGDLGLFWTTGGGFSNAYPKRPSWQDAAVSNYLKKATLPPSTSFNNTGRAYPDVSAVGHNLVVVDAGVAQPIDGTSAASPIFAALISLLNEERIAAGKSSLGFLNKWIYSIGSTAFNDVTVGDTTFCEQGQCCPTPSYTAIAGWDAASGWGAPNFPVLLKEALKLA